MTATEQFAEMLKNHNRIVFFGGAGVSTESDIPDFRGKTVCTIKRMIYPGHRRRCFLIIFMWSIRQSFSRSTKNGKA